MCDFYTYVDPDLISRVKSKLSEAEESHVVSSKGLFPKVELDGLDVSHLLTYLHMLRGTMNIKRKEEKQGYVIGKDYIRRGCVLILRDIYKKVYPERFKRKRKIPSPTGPFI